LEEFDWLRKHECRDIALESTGVLWDPVYFALLVSPFICMLLSRIEWALLFVALPIIIAQEYLFDSYPIGRPSMRLPPKLYNCHEEDEIDR